MVDWSLAACGFFSLVLCGLWWTDGFDGRGCGPLPLLLIMQMPRSSVQRYLLWRESSAVVWPHERILDARAAWDARPGTERAVSVVVHVFAWRRLRALQRLWTSLLTAEAPTRPVNVVLHVDGGALPSVTRFVREALWPYGSKTVVESSENMGLETAIMTGLSSASAGQLMLVLEDDLGASPLLFVWADAVSRHWHAQGQQDARLFGYALHTPRVDELTATEDFAPIRWLPTDALDGRLFAMQLPCSWGTVVPTERWTAFAQYYDARTRMEGNLVQAFSAKSHGWTRSWKRYAVEWFVYAGMYQIYINAPNQQSIVTNHYEVGVHSFAPWHEPLVPDVLREDIDERFAVPLFCDRVHLNELIDQMMSPTFLVPIVAWTHKMTDLTAFATETCRIQQQLLTANPAHTVWLREMLPGIKGGCR